MKRLKLITSFIFCLVFVTSCRIGSQTISSGIADNSRICFIAQHTYNIAVEVDGIIYNTQTVKNKNWRNDRNIKATEKTSIILSTGQHNVSVKKEGVVIFTKKIFISANETKMIQL